MAFSLVLPEVNTSGTATGALILDLLNSLNDDSYLRVILSAK